MDIELAQSLVHSVAWGAFVKMLEEDIEKLKDDLVNVQVPDRVGLLQERIKTIRLIIRKPNFIIDNAEENAED